jgi:hypothetical protein
VLPIALSLRGWQLWLWCHDIAAACARRGSGDAIGTTTSGKKLRAEGPSGKHETLPGSAAGAVEQNLNNDLGDGSGLLKPCSESLSGSCTSLSSPSEVEQSQSDCTDSSLQVLKHWHCVEPESSSQLLTQRSLVVLERRIAEVS